MLSAALNSPVDDLIEEPVMSPEDDSGMIYRSTVEAYNRTFYKFRYPGENED